MYKINSYVMPIHTRNGSTIVTNGSMRIEQRVIRLQRELRMNQLPVTGK
jgi:hypothetical protein